MAVVNYDRAVSYYDATRGYPDGVPDQIRDAILAHVGADMSTQFLELAIGTGLIGVPFIEAGYRYIGADISAQMMAQIAPKLTRQVSPDLLQVNIMQTLPFVSQCIDVVLAVRVFHMLDNWQSALDAIQRILKPDGYVVIAHETLLDTSTLNPFAVTNQKWQSILDQLGQPKARSRPRLWQKAPAIQSYLHDLGAQSQIVDLCQFESSPWSIQMAVDNHKQRIYRADWQLSDHLHTQAVAQLDEWVTSDCDNVDEEVRIPMVFRAIVARW